MEHKYNYFYRITNLITGQFYYGIHSTNKIDDGYMGSGSRIKEAYKQYCKENFCKEILKYFPTREMASVYESDVVTEDLIHNSKCYNMKLGGDYGYTVGSVLAIDRNGKMFRVLNDDERFSTGEIKIFMAGKVSVFDKTDGCYKIVTCDEYQTNKDRYITHSNGMVVVKDKDGQVLRVSVDNERYLNGELLPWMTGYKRSEESKSKQRKRFKEIGHQKGEKNSGYGTCWITKDGENLRVKRDNLNEYLKGGWKIGRDMGEDFAKSPFDSISPETMMGYINDGHTWKEAMEHFNMSKASLHRYKKRHNL